MLDLHTRELARHGGPRGIRDEGMLDSALARPRDRHAYGDPAPDTIALAAAYAFGLAQNHPFVDGNKRASLTSCVLFLRLNGYDLPVAMAAIVATWQSLAAGLIGEDDLTAWLRVHAVALRPIEDRYGGWDD